MKRALSVLACILMCTAYVFAANQRVLVTKVVGKVFVKLSEKSGWTKCYEGMTFTENTGLRTEARSKVKLMLYDGSSIVVDQKSDILVKDLTDAQKTIIQNKGKARFKISKLLSGRTFECRTPTAVCSIRGTEFGVDVGEDGLSTIKVFTGLVNVRQIEGLGEEFSVNPNEKIDVAVNVPPSAPVSFSGSDSMEAMSIKKEDERDNTKDEVRMDMTKEAVQNAAANEMKLAEYQKGKTMVDVFGDRVRLEEYIIRTEDNQFKMVVLNERKDRFDYFTWYRTFNKGLPPNMGIANNIWKNWAKSDKTATPEYYPVEDKNAATNTVDVFEWKYSGGNIIQSGNNYAHSFTNTTVAYNKDVIYDKGLGINKIDMDSIVIGATPLGNDKVYTKDSANLVDGGWYSEEYYAIDDFGKVASSKKYNENPLKYNEEFIIKSSKFTGPGKKIDLCISPEIFAESGLQ